MRTNATAVGGVAACASAVVKLLKVQHASAMQRQLAILSHLRWISAALVALSHFRNLLMQDFSGGSVAAKAFYFVTSFGHSAVVVFFVLSGFLVGRKIRRMAREDRPDLGRYMIDRFSRIFVVAWPAIALSLLALVVIMSVAPASPFATAPGWSSALQTPLAQEASPARWFAVAGLLNELLTRTPAINGPLWSLACEWTYYVAAGAGVAIFRRRWSWLIPYALILVTLAVLQDQMMVVGGVIWLLGMLASVVADRDWLRGRSTLFVVSLVAVAVVGGSKIFAIPDLVLGGVIAALVAHSHWKSWSWGAPFGERLAAFSYTLYATHFPFAVLFIAALHLQHRLAFGVAGVIAVFVAFLGSVALARGFAFLTEDRTAEIRDALLAIGSSRALARSA